MPKVTPFCAIRPVKEAAERFCALPYDVYNRSEAKAIVAHNPLSFLAIDRAETAFPDEVSTYADKVYEKARELLKKREIDGTLMTEEAPCYYLYELTMDGRTQTGLVACSSVEDYLNGVIKKHENTREEKEQDRILHVDETNTHTGPIFLIYRAKKELRALLSMMKENKEPLYDFTHEDGIRHRAFRIDEPDSIKRIEDIFQEIPCTYIADGHHRCASAVKVGLMRKEADPDFTGNEGYYRFLSVLFSDDELQILPYNRVVRDLNGFSAEEFLNRVSAAGFEITELSDVTKKSDNSDITVSGDVTGLYGQTDIDVSPKKKAEFSLYLEEKWYRLAAKPELLSTDAVKGLDVSILQDAILGPILGIEDPRTDKRIDFVGGIRGNRELVRRCHTDMKLAFALYPTSIGELLSVADAGRLMPPKSTWFEPKLLSGMFLHSLDD